MRTHLLGTAVLLLVALFITGCNQTTSNSSNKPPQSAGGSPAVTPAGAPGAPVAKVTSAGDYTISEPLEHQNLTLFLIHGPDKTSKTYLTLQEALEDKKVIVYETGSVNDLSIENVSDEDVYLQSGDIVKGGRQDRTIENDVVLSGKSGKVSLAVFCVEAGRWHQRGSENAAAFESSSGKLATKGLQLSAKNANDQSMVWANVGAAQQQLSNNSGTIVNDRSSPSSLQLSLENPKVQEAVDAYRDALEDAPKGQNDVVGYAFAVNGKLNSIDIYATHALFKKMWGKNLRAAATDAFAEFKKDAKWEKLTAAAVKDCLADAAQGKATSKDLDRRIKLVTRETKNNWSYETIDQKNAAPAHLNIITRDPESDRMLQRQQNMNGVNQPINGLQINQGNNINDSPNQQPANGPQIIIINQPPDLQQQGTPQQNAPAQPTTQQ